VVDVVVVDLFGDDDTTDVVVAGAASRAGAPWDEHAATRRRATGARARRTSGCATVRQGPG